jgi:hypothetical protein
MSLVIDDLAQPQIPPAAKPILDRMAAAGVGLTLDADRMMADAVAATGLTNFGAEDGFRERLDVFICALKEANFLSPGGVFAQQQRITQLLQNRLLIEERIRCHPEIADIRIEKPVIIGGLPRTGTTLLHNLLACDQKLRSLPLWESLEPVLSERERLSLPAGAPDPRITRAEQQCSLIDLAMPHFKLIHEVSATGTNEETELLAIDFSSLAFEMVGPVPVWRDYYLAHDQRARYTYMKRVLQCLQFLRGGERWVLKAPQHIEQLGVLLATFPDATFVLKHRDPVAVTACMATMLTYGARLSHAQPDPVRIGGYWAQRIATMSRSCVRDRDLLPPAQAIDVRYTELMAEPMAMIERMYACANMLLSVQAKTSMQHYMVLKRKLKAPFVVINPTPSLQPHLHYTNFVSWV